MSYFVIKKDCASQVYDNEDFEVEVLEFISKDKAETYLNKNNIESPMLKRIREMNPGISYPNRLGKKWTSEEDDELLIELNMGKSIEEISSIHQRTVGGITSRINTMILNMHNKGETIEEISRKILKEPSEVMNIIQIQNTNKISKSIARKTNSKKDKLKMVEEWFMSNQSEISYKIGKELEKILEF